MKKKKKKKKRKNKKKKRGRWRRSILTIIPVLLNTGLFLVIKYFYFSVSLKGSDESDLKPV